MVADAGDYYRHRRRQVSDCACTGSGRAKSGGDGTLVFNAQDPGERYSAMDALREQGNIYLTCPLYAQTSTPPGNRSHLRSP